MPWQMFNQVPAIQARNQGEQALQKMRGDQLMAFMGRGAAFEPRMPSMAEHSARFGIQNSGGMPGVNAGAYSPQAEAYYASMRPGYLPLSAATGPAQYAAPHSVEDMSLTVPQASAGYYDQGWVPQYPTSQRPSSWMLPSPGYRGFFGGR